MQTKGESMSTKHKAEMTPEEAKARYEAEWPALHAAKEAAQTKAGAKQCRQALSHLSKKYAARFELNKPEPVEEVPEFDPEPFGYGNPNPQHADDWFSLHEREGWLPLHAKRGPQ